MLESDDILRDLYYYLCRLRMCYEYKKCCAPNLVVDDSSRCVTAVVNLQ